MHGMLSRLSALKIGSLQAVLLTQLIVTGDWNTRGGTWDYGHANSDLWNINGGLNAVTDICSFGDRFGWAVLLFVLTYGTYDYGSGVCIAWVCHWGVGIRAYRRWPKGWAGGILQGDYFTS